MNHHIKFLLSHLKGGILATIFIALSRYVSDFSCIFGERMRMYEKEPPRHSFSASGPAPFLIPLSQSESRMRKKGRKGRTEREHIILIDR